MSDPVLLSRLWLWIDLHDKDEDGWYTATMDLRLPTGELPIDPQFVSRHGEQDRLVVSARSRNKARALAFVLMDTGAVLLRAATKKWGWS